MEGTGRKTTDYIGVSLLPCSSFSHQGWFWLINTLPTYLGNMTNLPDIQNIIGPILDLIKVPDAPSVLDRAQLHQDQRPSKSLLHQRPRLHDPAVRKDKKQRLSGNLQKTTVYKIKIVNQGHNACISCSCILYFVFL